MCSLLEIINFLSESHGRLRDILISTISLVCEYRNSGRPECSRCQIEFIWIVLLSVGLIKFLRHINVYSLVATHSLHLLCEVVVRFLHSAPVHFEAEAFNFFNLFTVDVQDW